MNNQKKIEKEIEYQKTLLDFLSFEQNHILADYMPRMIAAETTSITIAIALFNLEYWLEGLFLFIVGMIFVFKYIFELKKERNKIQNQRVKIMYEISKKYNKLGINIQEISSELFK